MAQSPDRVWPSPDPPELPEVSELLEQAAVRAATASRATTAGERRRRPLDGGGAVMDGTVGVGVNAVLLAKA
ncbi:hypothetical protein GCM10009639_50860 [Kitasatospora putterlickiae]|uniref:Uncharacterized protein n=1 Tax=Kitasatospora putterlickiae TaxID=221725 RepID=A0ABP4J688_9ACTN